MFGFGLQLWVVHLLLANMEPNHFIELMRGIAAGGVMLSFGMVLWILSGWYMEQSEGDDEDF